MSVRPLLVSLCLLTLAAPPAFAGQKNGQRQAAPRKKAGARKAGATSRPVRRNPAVEEGAAPGGGLGATRQPGPGAEAARPVRRGVVQSGAPVATGRQTTSRPQRRVARTGPAGEQRQANQPGGSRMQRGMAQRPGQRSFAPTKRTKGWKRFAKIAFGTVAVAGALFLGAEFLGVTDFVGGIDPPSFDFGGGGGDLPGGDVGGGGGDVPDLPGGGDAPDLPGGGEIPDGPGGGDVPGGGGETPTPGPSGAGPSGGSPIGGTPGAGEGAVKVRP